MNRTAWESRVPEIYRRCLATAPEDFVTRGEATGDIGEVLDHITWDALIEDPDRSSSPDGVSVQIVRTADRKLDCECGLHLLAGDGNGWAVPLHATFWISEDLNSVTSYEVKIADTSHERRHTAGARVGRNETQQWSIILRWPEC